jgi:carbon-monoxide dehydrogenase small subunit
VIVEGRPVNSCVVLAVEVEDKDVRTIEGEADGENLSALQQAFIDEGAIQCGFCTPGMVMSGRALLLRNPHPSEEEAREAICGNLCRCTGYKPIVSAILEAARREKKHA